MQRLAEDISDPASEKTAIVFLNRCVTVWGQPSSSENGQETGHGLPGFERFIYERLVQTCFHVPSLPQFNLKDGQMMVVRWSFSTVIDGLMSLS